jgi:hypothetical protein
MHTILGDKLLLVNHNPVLILHRKIRSVGITPDLSQPSSSQKNWVVN